MVLGVRKVRCSSEAIRGLKKGDGKAADALTEEHCADSFIRGTYLALMTTLPFARPFAR